MTGQNATPLFDALKAHIDEAVVPFHVPGHKQGKGLRDLTDYLGVRTMQMDLNGMPDLDFVNHPSGVIMEAQKLFAYAFEGDEAFFLVNGTTSGVQAMIMSVCEPGNEIIIPRNAHKSTIGGLILSGAIPIYLYPECNSQLGIAMGITLDSVSQAIKEHPHAKAIFLINPTYYGFTSDLRSIVRTAHAHNMAVLVDEAHGAHMAFHNSFPISAMAAGADMSAVSMHKTAGSLTQSSALLLQGSLVPCSRVKQVLNLSYTSSASYLLMCSLDVARRQMATNGKDLLEKTIQMVRWARQKINQIPGFYAFGHELIGSPGCFDFDETKLGINVRRLNYSGYQIENLLRQNYRIQVEMSDINNILAITSIGDEPANFKVFVDALQEIASCSRPMDYREAPPIPAFGKMIVSPRDAFYGPKKILSLKNAVGEIAGEMIMAYPPGIPVVCMGERITTEIVDYIELLKKEKCELQGTADRYLDYIQVLGRN
ncbi:MAG: aminotransferase class I/II-fold pyridoxal phosphate-dependent enzyme [Syntrophomonas sp.]